MTQIDVDFFEKGTRIPRGGVRMERIFADFLKWEPAWRQFVRIFADFFGVNGGFMLD